MESDRNKKIRDNVLTKTLLYTTDRVRKIQHRIQLFRTSCANSDLAVGHLSSAVTVVPLALVQENDNRGANLLNRFLNVELLKKEKRYSVVEFKAKIGWLAHYTALVTSTRTDRVMRIPED